MRTQWGTATDTGGRRSANEDAVLARPPVFAVADGMGGHARGDMASRTVVEELDRLAQGAAAPGRGELEQALQRAADRIQRTMSEGAGEGWLEAQDAVAGTTVAGVVLTEQEGRPSWLVLNVGDSRVYRMTGGSLTQVSVDHSLVQELVDAGALTPEAARHHPQRNVITRAVGTGGGVEPDFWVLPVEVPDRLLLCTDGLFGELDEQEITEVLTTESDPARAAQALLERALAGGADDNVTVLVLDAE